jgi:hypothetical protein
MESSCGIQQTMADSHVVIVDPLAATWGRESLLELMRSSPDGRHRSVLLRPNYCRHPRCECAEVEFEINRIDEILAGVSKDDAQIQRLLEDRPIAPEAMTLVLELHVGKFCWIGIRDEDGPGPEPEAMLERGKGVSDEMLSWAHVLEQCIDGPILEELWNRHLLARGHDPKRLHRRPPDNYEDGTLEWCEVCPTARRDVFFDGDADMMIVAHDDYCPNPKCMCAEAHVSFATLEGIIGTVAVSVETDGLDFVPHEGWSSDELQAAWKRYVERWPDYRVRLRDRHHRLRATLDNAMQRKFAALTTSVSPRRSEAKVGRNAPCPCGSGRKYKRCCGENRESTANR